jgi:hypothetical protein
MDSPSNRDEFFAQREKYFTNIRREEMDVSKEWEKFKVSWSQNETACAVDVGGWISRIGFRETKARLLEDSFNFSEEYDLANPILFAPSLKSLKSMQQYFIEILSSIQ